MKISIITPTHKDIPYLKDLYQSIKSQLYQNWEWIVWVNGKATEEHVKRSTDSDERVKIFTDTTNNPNVGYHKHHAFKKGTGEILAEVDHDDMLMPECLLKVAQAFANNQDVGFVYSDNLKYQTQGEFIPYNPVFGWQHFKYDVVINGEKKTLWCPRSFKPTSHAMTYIYYMPDHIRCWRSDVYMKLNGHDVSYDVLDDQELIYRTYLHTKFHFIPEPLYIYRIDGSNTYLERSKKIAELTHKMAFANAQRLAERDAELNNKLKIDIGGGIDKRPGYISVDKYDGDIMADLDEGIPLPDDSVGVINASHVLEHLKDPLKSMTEIHRVLHHGGWAFIDVPSTDGRGAWQDPTHVSFWNENSFLYYYKAEQARYIRNNKVRFMKFRCETHYPSKWWEDMKIPVVSAWLIAIKDDSQRLPGMLEI